MPGVTRTFLLDVPFDDRLTAKWAGARWDPKVKKWTWRGSALPADLAAFAAPAYSWERWCEEEANGGWQPEPTTSAITLHEHQRQAARHIAAARKAKLPGFLLADDVGLGKTYSAIAGVDALGRGLRILVVAPLSVLPHWRRSIADASHGENRYCVINYDRLKHLLDAPASAATAKRTRTRNKRTAAAGKSKVAWDVVVFDEAHLLRNPTAQRTGAARQLVTTGPSGKRRTPAFTLWLSATAGQNPLELNYLAPLLAAVTGSSVTDLAAFESWCTSQGIGVTRGRFGAWQWVRNDADLARMRELLFESSPVTGVRRRPQDLAGWPEQQRIPYPVELDPAQRRDYERAWTEFLAIHDAARSSRARTKGEDNPLTALLRLRQKASLLRVEPTADLVADCVANDRQVAVSVAFLDTARALADALSRRGISSTSITGEMSPGEREQARVAFQTGEHPVVIFTVTEGISLHAGEAASAATDTERILVVHDPRWSAIATAQIEGRCHRDGRNAVAYHCYGDDTAEGAVVDVTLQRLRDMKTMVGDDVDALELMEQVRSGFARETGATGRRRVTVGSTGGSR